MDRTILLILLEMSRIPSATKFWRLQTGDAFNDVRFFRTPHDLSQLWKPLLCALFSSDKESFGELLGMSSIRFSSPDQMTSCFLYSTSVKELNISSGRIAAAPSSNIFTNRENEMISRSTNLRRLAFVLLAAGRDHYLPQLPSIQGKLVEILRTNAVSPRVHSEVGESSERSCSC